MAEPLRHRQTKEAETDMPGLPPPRHIPTLPTSDLGMRRRCLPLSKDKTELPAPRVRELFIGMAQRFEGAARLRSVPGDVP